MRKGWRRWFASSGALRAYLNIIVVVALMLLRHRIPNGTGPADPILRGALLLLLVAFLARPIIYFAGPLLSFLATWLMIRFARERPEYPCPVCGYDIRETPHRCPECGTKLRWGQLPY